MEPNKKQLRALSVTKKKYRQEAWERAVLYGQAIGKTPKKKIIRQMATEVELEAQRQHELRAGGNWMYQFDDHVVLLCSTRAGVVVSTVDLDREFSVPMPTRTAIEFARNVSMSLGYGEPAIQGPCSDDVAKVFGPQRGSAFDS